MNYSLKIFSVFGIPIELHISFLLLMLAIYFVALFNLINHLHEQCSIIITTNKSPKQWAETLEDEVLATALLDRILYHCEVIKLEGSSYRMEHRKEIISKG